MQCIKSWEENLNKSIVFSSELTMKSKGNAVTIHNDAGLVCVFVERISSLQLLQPLVIG